MKKLVIALTLGILVGSAATAMAETNETVQATFAKFALKINGESKELKTDPLVVDGTSYLPVREVASLVGFTVDYDSVSRTIKLDKTKGTDTMNTNVTADSAPPSRTTPEGWIKLYDVTDKFGSSWGATTIGLTKKTGEKITLPIYYGMPSGDFTVQTDKGSSLRIKVVSEAYILLNSDDLKEIGFYPQ